jgi:hypothetical protein
MSLQVGQFGSFIVQGKGQVISLALVFPASFALEAF